MKQKTIPRDFEGEYKLKKDFGEAMEKDQQYTPQKFNVDYMILIGRCAFKLSTIKTIYLQPIPKDQVKDEVDTIVFVDTDEQTHIAFIQSKNKCQEVIKKVCDKINELISTCKDKNE